MIAWALHVHQEDVYSLYINLSKFDTSDILILMHIFSLSSFHKIRIYSVCEQIETVNVLEGAGDRA